MESFLVNAEKTDPNIRALYAKLKAAIGESTEYAYAKQALDDPKKKALMMSVIIGYALNKGYLKLPGDTNNLNTIRGLKLNDEFTTTDFLTLMQKRESPSKAIIEGIKADGRLPQFVFDYLYLEDRLNHMRGLSDPYMQIFTPHEHNDAKKNIIAAVDVLVQRPANKGAIKSGGNVCSGFSHDLCYRLR